MNGKSKNFLVHYSTIPLFHESSPLFMHYSLTPLELPQVTNWLVTQKAKELHTYVACLYNGSKAHIYYNLIHYYITRTVHR